ncbi:DUF1963 domain-containing protein [Actinomadura logoneensis]|uniref:DUF1963 domain-containing protein n=1 Tax=Actinomadura logoneensis TaxID=2293572 RepID=A0A372JQV5_9ACTN|nr:DUF1963 domain-containing protein [Actinomadura logoneensis]RFU42425.1 DUF1963 domain-containing protein [Actinomadura logoneensis]
MNAELFRRLHPLFSAFLTPETAGILLSLARPALRLVPGGSSAVHLGGRPLLPAGEPWPTVAGRPMEHLCTIDFAAMPPLDGLPTRGYASFYHSGVTPGAREGESPVDDGWRIYAHDLVPATPTVTAPPLAAGPWAVAPFWSLPSPLDPALGLLERARPGTLGSYRFLYDSWLDQVWADKAPRHQIGGWPVLLEADRPLGPPLSDAPPPVSKTLPRSEADRAVPVPTREPRTGQMVRPTECPRTVGQGAGGRAAPSLRDPLPSRFGSVCSPYATTSGVEDGRSRAAGSGRHASVMAAATAVAPPGGTATERPVACHSPGTFDGEASASSSAVCGGDRVRRGGDGRDPAFLFPRTPRRSVSVLPSNVHSVRLEEIRAAVVAARSERPESRRGADKEARAAAEARKAATRRLTERLRECLDTGRLVLQLDSDPGVGWFWGDPGSLFFAVRPDSGLESAWLTRHAL